MGYQSDYANTCDFMIGRTCSVAEFEQGLSPFGCFNMAGNVSEWIAHQHADPASPVKPAMWMVAGGGYDRSEAGAGTLRWLDESALKLKDARNYRSANLGFRAVSDYKPRE